VILRIWRGQATAANANAYFTHVTQHVFPNLTKLPGHRGASVLRRESDGAVEFVVITRWDSLDAVRAFAGAHPEVAVVEPAARALLADFDATVRHYDLAYDSTSDAMLTDDVSQ
jgi:heme-degrading monooxygenase HmoA